MDTFQLKMQITTLTYMIRNNVNLSPHLNDKLLFLMDKFTFQSYWEWIESDDSSYYRTDKSFSKEELENYNGLNSNPAYVAIYGVVYDVSDVPSWSGANHFELTAGKDLTSDFINCHPNSDILSTLKKVGILK